MISKLKDGSKDQTVTGLRFEIRGLGPVPSFKNKKRAIVQRNGKAKPITDPKTKKWMARATERIALQLLCGSATGGGATPTAAQRRYLIALLPPDDCWTAIPLMTIESKLCSPGNEGATIEVEWI